MPRPRRETGERRRHRTGISGGAPRTLQVSMLGGFRVFVGSRIVEEDGWRLGKAGSLVKLLALTPGHHLHRNRVMERLWPDLDRAAAANNLYRTLHAARRTLEPEDGASRYLRLQNERLHLCPDGNLWVDAEAFEETAAAARGSRKPEDYRAALDLYAGDLLPDDRSEKWTEKRRKELRELHLSLHVELAGLYEQRGEYGTAIETLERVVAEEPAREEPHAALMRLYALTGRRQKALRQYEQLKGALSAEPGKQLSEPGVRSRHLYEEILVGRFPPVHRPYADPLSGKPPGTQLHNLPAARTSFIGREREISEIQRLLVTTRLLTLTGGGGCGKTRLALEVTRDLAVVYPDGVWLAELASITDPSLVPQTVARVFGVREPPNRTLADALANVLRTKKTLLLLDNCEHLVEAAARLVETLLDNCPDLRVLATSREVLGVSGEVSWPVPPLSVPEQASTLEELEKAESAQLFVDRALQQPAAFVLTEQNAGIVMEICRSLDGIPLAIELAAARVGVLTLQQISERLTDALKLLSVGPRTAEPRHQTLRGALDWSYELLDDKEHKLFRGLSAFAGGWTLKAAETVGAGDGIEKDDILDLLSSLVDKSLVVAGVSEPARYRLLEPVRQYAWERLEESGEAEEVRRRHALWCMELAERAEPELTGPDQVRWLERLEPEHDNIRSALGWAFDAKETELGLRLAASLWLFWYTRGHTSEGRGWLERGISGLGTGAPQLRAKALNGAGWIALFQPDYDGAEAFLEESLALYRELEDKEGIASCLVNLGFVALLGERNLESVPAYTEEAVRLRPQIEDRRTIANPMCRF